MFIFSFKFLMFTCFIFDFVDNAPLTKWQKNVLCAEVPTLVLEQVLGGAFNPRYMSIDQPIVQESSPGGKRDIAFEEDFYVEDYFSEEVDSEAAWNVHNHVLISKKRYGYDLKRKKRGTDYMQQWNCKSKIEWIDLGSDYFPRYLRSVVCLSDKCWFGLYKCKPRSFTVKLLRRKRGLCVDNSENNNNIGLIGLPKELKDLWVWEERALTFCCDCTRV